MRIYAEAMGMFTLLIVREASVAPDGSIYYGMINQQIDLDHYVKCERKWLFNTSEIEAKFELQQSNIGMYSCPPGQKAIYVFAVEHDLSFDDKKSVVFGDAAVFSCSVTFWVGTDEINSEMEVSAEMKAIDNRNRNFSSGQHENNILSVYTSRRMGINQVYCSWKYVVRVGDITFAGSTVKNTTLEVCRSPDNVGPDEKTVTKDGPRFVATINGTVSCTSDAYPPANYNWSCFESGWSASGERITFHDFGDYNCTCVADNIVEEKVRPGYWSGTIQVNYEGHNVGPGESTLIKDGDRFLAKANEVVLCTSDAHPPVNYNWSCHENGWTASGEKITFHDLGAFNCTCFAERIMKKRAFSRSWNGIIHVGKEVIAEKEITLSTLWSPSRSDSARNRMPINTNLSSQSSPSFWPFALCCWCTVVLY